MGDMFGDIFGDLFGGGRTRRGGGNGPVKGANILASVKLTFKEAILAVKRSWILTLKIHVQSVTVVVQSPELRLLHVQNAEAPVRLL